MMRFKLYMEGQFFGGRHEEFDLNSLFTNVVMSPSRPNDRPPRLELWDDGEKRFRPDLVEKFTRHKFRDVEPEADSFFG